MNARAVALAALADWRRGERFADVIIQGLLRETPLASADRAFANELFYGALRNLTLLDFWISQLRDGNVDPETRDILRLGLYQLLLLRTPSHAAVFETVALGTPRTRPVINGVLRSAVRRFDELENAAADQPPQVRFSHPEFLLRRWEEQFGAAAMAELCAWNNRPAPVYARINQLKTIATEFVTERAGAALLPNESRFATLIDPRPALTAGACYIQDPSTLVACDLLAPQPEELVLDACAAPGGKTSYLAQLMQNRGTIIACDRVPDRLHLLRGNLERLGVANARVLQHDWRGALLSEELASTRFDRILVDAPCSNTGVMRRRLDVRWRLRPTDFARIAEEQMTIVRHVVPLLRAGGVLVYSTCSLEPEENEEIAARIVAEFPSLTLAATKIVLPFRDGYDGAFAAQFVCK